MLFDISQVLKAIDVSIADISGQSQTANKDKMAAFYPTHNAFRTAKGSGVRIKATPFWQKAENSENGVGSSRNWSDPFSAFPVFVVSR